VNLQSLFRNKISAPQKIILILTGLFLCLLLLEIGLWIGGFILLSFQEHRNRISIRQKRTYRILCLGESTTFGQWPRPLEEILNQRDIGIKFSVIDKGLPGTTTTRILARLEDNLNKYNPDMIITMMGKNDKKETIPHENISPKKTILFLKAFKTYKLAKLLWLRIENKTRETGKCNLSEKDDAIAKTKDSLQPNILEEILSLTSRAQEKIYKKAIELNPRNDRAYLELGLFYCVKGKYDKAVETLKEAIELNPRGDCHTYFALGLCYKNQGKYEQAEEMFKEAIKINPRYDMAYFELARRYMDRGKYDKAEGLLKEATKINPGNDNIYGSLALCYEEQGKYKLAKEYFKKANRLRLENYNPITQHNYQRLKEIVTQRGIRLVCVQYPMRNIEPLKKIFEKSEEIIFVDNENLFKELLKKANYDEYFIDAFAGDSGHCSDKGNRLIAENIADVILKKCFNKMK